MTTDNIILGKFYELLNVVGVTGIINGEVWKISKAVGRQVEDIVINTLTNTTTNNDHLNIGIMNINSFTSANNDHTANTLRMDVINGAIITALGQVNGEGSFGVLNFRIVSQKTFRDQDDPTMFFSNLQINYSYKN